MDKARAIQMAFGYDIREDHPPRPLPQFDCKCQACGCKFTVPVGESFPVFCAGCDATDDKWVRRRRRYEAKP